MDWLDIYQQNNEKEINDKIKFDKKLKSLFVNNFSQYYVKDVNVLLKKLKISKNYFKGEKRNKYTKHKKIIKLSKKEISFNISIINLTQSLIKVRKKYF